MDSCAKLRGIFHEERIGHGGTLDPMATGVLPVFVGRATRAVEFATEGKKEYIAGLKLGVMTNTQDTTGQVLEQRPVQVDRETLDAILEAGLWAPSGMGMQSPVLVAVQDPEIVALLSRLNARVLGQPEADPFYGAPTVVVVLADTGRPTWRQDGSLVMGNLMTAAASLGVGSCWIHRAEEAFDVSEGRALLAQWGLPGTLRGVGHCILGYADGPAPAPKPRRDGRIVRV